MNKSKELVDTRERERERERYGNISIKE